MTRYLILLAFLFASTSSSLKAQVFNDECENALFLGSIVSYCSEFGEFTNTGATLSNDVEPFCWFNTGADVWFSFTPASPGVLIQMFGRQLSGDGAIVQPEVALYQGPCNNLVELGCNTISTGPNDLNLTVTDLIIGQTYYIRAAGRDMREGNFQLCVQTFVPVPSPQSDCNDAVILCDKSPFVVENLQSVGNDPTELDNSTCPSNGASLEESASVWYTWTCDQSGTLTFTLTPNNIASPDEDLDFVVFRLPNGIGDCTNKEELRCMFSGESQQNPPAQNAPCLGSTGLRNSSTDVNETPGCDPGDDNFLAPLDMISGESYALVVNNFSQSGLGFAIDFGGTGTFLGPVPDFDLEVTGDVLECDKEVTFSNASMSLTDPIVDFSWSFGVGAMPQLANGQGPHVISYSSFGPKTATLTVTSDKGCTVTKILDVFVEPCCMDTSTLALTLSSQDVLCATESTGLIEVNGISGASPYMYSLDGVNFQPSATFSQLPAGDYDVFIQDIKGCIEQETVTITEPPLLSVEAGDDIEVDLGFTGEANGVVTNPFGNFTISWTPEEGLSCTDCLNPTIQAGAVSQYVIMVTDENGCTATDVLNVDVNLVRPIYPPNIFSPNRDGVNDYFRIYFGPAVSGFDLLRVYDRWGNLMYEGRNLPLQGDNVGWNGLFKGTEVNPGVFTWVADITFIDNQTITYSGDITLLK